MLCSLHRLAEKLHGSSALAAAVPGVVHCPVKRAQCGRSPSLNSCRMVLLPRPQGFIVTRWAAEFDEARAQLAAWMADGKILQGALA